ncbi:MAG: UDP-N-acetylmuramoyl-tripeptide--D-alanyl-D-alanine ligase [Deltaproteobacteria bacterium]|nr:UDP-N-acetylmuramoyl-tripeptide--D-alanyl-D-alanine ligase [Deltaproteobacteria bacterium]
MSIGLSKNQVCEITGGISVQDGARLNFERIEYDSREIRGGEMFIALKGAQSHGHDHIEMALSRGAALCLVEDEQIAKNSSHPDRMVVVRDTLQAFWTLAKWWRRELALPVLAVTGSVGKTTIKELAAALLLKWNKGAYSQKSHNNHVGVPYTICRISREHRWAVLEMGMNHAGEISNLTRLGEPDVALISLIAPAHIESFASIDGIVDAKFEILEGLKPGGSIILNHDDVRQVAKWNSIRGATNAQVRFFGSSEECDARISNVRAFGLEGIEFDLRLLGEDLPVTLRMLGKHNAYSAAAAALAVKALVPEITNDQIMAGLTDFKAPLMRLAMKHLKSGKRLIDDSYNANPASMGALLDIAADLKQENLRIGLLLGDMLELGAEAEQFHREVGEKAAALKPQFLIAVGPNSKYYVEAAEKQGVRAVDGVTPEAAAQLARKLDFDILLVKASRGIGLDRAVKIIFERDGA